VKKPVLSILLSMAAFAASYLALCYLVPAWRIKLQADPATYFVESVRHMALLKGLLSLAVGLIAGVFPLAAGRRAAGSAGRTAPFAHVWQRHK